MSVFVTIRVGGDATKLEALYAKDPATFSRVSSRAEPLGVISHRFYATDTEILVLDEWPDEGSFMKFFESATEIPGIMAEAGATAAPEITFWRKLDLGDDIG